MESSSSPSFGDFPEDVQLNILSFLSRIDIANFACTSKRYAPLCQTDSKLWYALCDRRWGSKTQLSRWGGGNISYNLLYKTLNKWENFIGFWRRCGQNQQRANAAAAGVAEPPSLVVFEWGASFLRGSRVSPSRDGTYYVLKSPFLFMGISKEGQIVSYMDREGHNGIAGELGLPETDLVRVNVNFIGGFHFSLEEDEGFGNRIGGDESGYDVVIDGFESGSRVPSLPEIYQYYANRSSPGSDRWWRRQRRREKERQFRKRWETRHYLKIVDCSSTKGRPLQGLWKGFCDEMKLEFYLVEYDGVGISCRIVGDSSEHLSSYMPVFWTSNPTFVDSPLSPEELQVYDSMIHIRPSPDESHVHRPDEEVVMRVMYVNSSLDLGVPGLDGAGANLSRVEGRIWQYKSGAFGFGFLRDNFIVDLKHIAAENGCLLDTVVPSSD